MTEQEIKPQEFSPTTKFVLVVVVTILAIGGYFGIQALGDTSISLTLTSNDELEDGLIVHYTFDGNYIDLASTTGEVIDRIPTNHRGNLVNFEN